MNRVYFEVNCDIVNIATYFLKSYYKPTLF